MKSQHFIPRLQFILLILLLSGGLAYLYTEQVGQPLSRIFIEEYHVINIGEVPIEVELADTDEERERGLSGRTSIEGVDGLLLVFDRSDYHGVWMKDMLFAIDIFWISEEGRIVHIERSVTPDTYPQIFEPLRPAKYVLETEVLFADTYGISVGNKVRIPESIKNK